MQFLSTYLSAILLNCLIAILSLSNLASCGMLFATRAPTTAILNQGEQSLLAIYFQATTSLLSGSYLIIDLQDYGTDGYLLSTNSCLVKYSGTTSFISETCGVQSLTTVYVLLSQPVVNTSPSENVVQIDLQTLNPLSSMSKAIRLSTRSALNLPYSIYDFNGNFGSIPFAPALSSQFKASVVSYGTPSTVTVPGAANTLILLIEVNSAVGVDTGLSRIKLILPSPWTFSTSISVTTQIVSRVGGSLSDSMLYVNPIVVTSITGIGQQYTQVETPNQLSIVFNQALLKGSMFQLTISSIVNPTVSVSSATGSLRVYLLPVGSNEALEGNTSLLSLTTAPKTLTVNLLTSLGFYPTATPITFFKNTKHYLTVALDITSVTIPANSPIVLVFSAGVQVIQGSCYLNGIMLDSSSRQMRSIQYSGTTTIIISNLQSITGSASSPTLKIQTRALLSRSASTVSVTVSVYSDSTLTTALFSSSSTAASVQTNYNAAIYSIYDQSTGTNGYITIKPSSNDITFAFTYSTNDMSTSTQIDLYLSTLVVAEATRSCTLTRVGYSVTTFTSDCTLTIYTDYIRIRMIYNSYVATNGQQYIIILYGMKFSIASSHDTGTFEAFFRIFKTSSNLLTYYYDSMFPLIVMQPNNPLVTTSIVNSLDQSTVSLRDYSYPSFVQIVFQSNALSTLTLGANQIPYITLYSYQGFSTLVSTPASTDQFPCGSSLQTVSCYYYPSDSTTTLTTTLFKEWARITVLLPTTATSSTGFRVAVPYLFAAAAVHYYRTEIGIYNTDSFVFLVKSTQTAISITPSGTIAGLAGLCPLTAISLSGYAGATVNSIPITIGCNSPYTVGAAILVTDWEFWLQGTSAYAAVYSIVGTTYNNPVSLKYTDLTGKTRYAVIFPLTANPQPAAVATTIQVNKINLPYSYDLPDLLMMVTTGTSALNCYVKYINSGRGSFYSSPISSLSMTCDNQRNAVTNTRCVVQFNPAQMIQPYSILALKFQGIRFYTDTCWLYQITIATSAKTTMSQSCAASIDSYKATVSLSDNVVWPNDSTLYNYQLIFYGIEIDEDPDSTKGATLEIRDISGNTVIQTGSTIVITSAQSDQSITVLSISYSESNPSVVCMLSVQFVLPRDLQLNESLLIFLGTDLSDVNQNTDRMQVTLCIYTTATVCSLLTMTPSFNSDDNSITITVSNYALITTGTYILKINGITTPGANSNDKVSIRLIRNYDNRLVMSNIASATPSYPNLVAVAALSVFNLYSANFIQESQMQELTFNITTSTTIVTQFHKIYMYFPVYYSPALNNDQDYLYCQLNDIQITCAYSSTPYRLEFTDTPILIQPNTNLTLFISGIISPPYDLRYANKYVNETIQIAIDTGLTNAFAEYSHVTPPDVYRAGDASSYLRLISLTSSLLTTHSLSTHTFHFSSDALLAYQDNFKLIFPTEYTNIKLITTLTCYFQYYDDSGTLTTLNSSTCTVKGLQIYGTLPIQINAASEFFIILVSVPTPPADVVVDISQTKLAVFNSTNITYTAATSDYINRAAVVHYKEGTSSVAINSNAVITVTKGTYSNKITIAMSDGSKFSKNMVIGYSSKGFTMTPSLVSILLGDDQSTFRIGAEQSLMEKIYSLPINSAASVSTYYAQQLIVFVVSQQVQITSPTVISLPYNGGCSLAQPITLTSPPYDDLTILVQYDTDLLPEEYLIPNFDLSSYELEYSSAVTTRYFSICSTTAFPSSITSFNIQFSLIGTNQESYAFVNSAGVVTMKTVSASTNPTISFSVSAIARTTAAFNAAINMDGTVYYHLFISDTATAMSMDSIKRRIKYQNTVVQAQTTLTQQILGNKTDERVGLATMQLSVPATLLLSLDSLIQQTSYDLCYYFENELNMATAVYCKSFTTQSWNTFPKASLTFTREIFSYEMNNFLCFFVSAVQARIYNLMTSDGSSCSLQAIAQPYYFNYTGRTVSRTTLTTSFYVVPDAKREIDSSLSIFSGLFDPTTKIVLPGFKTYALSMGIDYISTGTFEFSFSYDSALAKTSQMVIPTVASIKFVPIAYETSTNIEIQGISLSDDGQVFFIGECVESSIYDPSVNSYFTSPMLSETSPSGSQIVKCLNALSQKPDLCTRAVYNNKQSITIVFEGLVPNANYRFYYVIANQFTIAPVYGETVVQMDVRTLPFKSMLAFRIAISTMLLILAMLF